MLGWFRSKLPVTSEQQEWIERRWGWLVEEFGEPRLKALPMILPTPIYFPDPYERTPTDAEAMFARVCGYMGVDRERIDLSFFSGKAPDFGERGGGLITSTGAAGYYVGGERIRIALEVAHLADPISLVATMAHELAHVLLLGDGRITVEVEDHEHLTDLLTVAMGFGIFTANACIRDSAKSDGQWFKWSVGKQGYLTQEEWGYALARYARFHGEAKPKWVRHLRPDIRAHLRRSARHIA